MHALFDDEPRTRRWLEILSVLAETQAEFDLIPRNAALAIATICRSVILDDAFFEELRADYEATGHSTLGLIQAIRKRCPGDSGEWFYFGATVQDLSDTWLMLALREARILMLRDLKRIERALAGLCRRHRDTVMAGRTHGQQGLPITFGFKAAGWLVELHRHRDRFVEIAKRMDVGQLCGGVGSLSALGPRALDLQRRFLERLGLKVPSMSWTVSRDVIAEWAHVLVLLGATADRIGHEIYTLQRDEIAEISESSADRAVGSITMPHKRNPERSEHLGTLNRVVRANASLLDESLVHDHERDGRSWKSEWHAVPELTMAAGKAINLLAELVERLKVDPARMRANLEASKGYILSEAAMLALAAKTGKQTAHRLIAEAAAQGRSDGLPFKEAVLRHRGIAAHLSAKEVERLFDYSFQAGQCAALVDTVLGAEQ
jgi:adenylosuccinate lyase